MRRIVIGMVGLAGVVALVAFVFRAELAVRLMEAAAARALSANALDELPDGLHVVLCGAGGPLADPRRVGPCVAVIAGRTMLVVDAGSGSARNLLRMGFSPGRIAALFVTHFHSDHIDGLGELALQRWTGSAAKSPMPVYGADGVREIVAGFNQAYRLDATYRTAHHGKAVAPPSGAGMVARPFAAPMIGASEVLWEQDGVKVIVFAVEHDPAKPAVGYRFDYGGRSAVVSGDTHKSVNVVAFARDTDLLVHEALSPRLVDIMGRAAAAAGRDGVAKIMSDIPDYHTPPVDAAAVATEAGVRHLLLYHVIPPLLVPGIEAAFVEGVDDVYRGGVTLGRDGVIVSLPSDSDTIDVGMRL